MIDKINPLYTRGLVPVPVIPTVYTDALSYGEQTGIMIHKIDECVDKTNEIVDDNNEFKTDLTNQQNTYETTITNQQNSFETELRNIEATFQMNITNRQNTYEQTTTAELNTWKTETKAEFKGQIDEMNDEWDAFVEQYQTEVPISDSLGNSSLVATSQKVVTNMFNGFVGWTPMRFNWKDNEYYSIDTHDFETLTGFKHTDYEHIGDNIKYLRITGKSLNVCPVISFFNYKHEFISSYPNERTTLEYNKEIISVPSNAQYYVVNDTSYTYSIHSIIEVSRVEDNWKPLYLTFITNKAYLIGSGLITINGFSCAKVDLNNTKYVKIRGKSEASAPLIAFLDKNDTVISSLPTVALTATIEATISVPNNAVSAYVNYPVGDFPSYIPSVCVQSSSTTKDFRQYKWANLGDSLAVKYPSTRFGYGYLDKIYDDTGIMISDLSESGTGYKNYTGHTFADKALTIPSDADVVTIFGGGNDCGKGYTLGDIDDTGTTTICGCINTAIDNVYATVPNAKLGIISTTPWKIYPTTTTNEMSNYVNAIKQICERRGIPFLDLFHTSGLHPWDNSFISVAYKFDSDGVHPDTDGNMFIAPKIEKFLYELLS